MSDNEKQEFGTREDVSGSTASPPSGKPRGGCKAHFRRFWWIHLIVFAIVVLVVVLPLIFVGIPHIAQSAVNKATMSVLSESVLNPQPAQVDVQLTSSVSSDSSFHPYIESFQAALFLEDTEPNIVPFGYITVPKSKAGKNTTIQISQTMQIANMDQFTAYNKLVLQSDTYRFAVRGRAGLKLSGLPTFDIDYNKAVTMKGLNGLKGFALTNFTILLTAEADGANMVGQLSIPNPSVMTVEMGNVTMDLSVAGVPIGTTLIPNLTLVPGNNTVNMRSTTNQSLVIEMVTKNYTSGILPVDVIGNSSINNQGEHLSYYEAAIQSNTLRLDLDVGAALNQIGLNFTALIGGS